MKRTTIVTLTVIMLFAASAWTPAQEGGSDTASDDNARTIEDLYLSRSPSPAVIRSMVVTNDRSTQMAGIRMLAQAAEDGAMNPDAEAYIEIAGHALRQGATEVSFTPGTVPNVYHPVIRVEAARALAAGSTQSARDLLVEAVRNDPEALVRAEAMLALAAQPRGNVNATLVEIADALRAEAAVGRDRYMLVSGLQAVEDLVPHADLKELDPMVRQTLVEIAASGLNRIVRETAVSALTSM